MVCRESALSSVTVSFVRAATGLEDNQILSLNHALMRAGAHATPPTAAEWNATIDDIQRRYESGELQAPRGARRIAERLEAARHETPTGARAWATTRLLRHAQAAVQTHNLWVRDYCCRTGQSEEQVRTRFTSLFDAASADATLAPSAQAAEDPAGLINAATPAVLRDRRSVYAYEQMEADQNRRFDSQATPSVTRTPVTGSSTLATMGYDANTGRCEVTFQSDPDRVYAYTMTPAEYQAFETAPSRGRHFARHIRGNPSHRLSADDARDTSRSARCATCGEFVGRTGHSCPPMGSAEARDRDMEAAVARRRGQAAPQRAALFPSRARTDVDFTDGQLTVPYATRILTEARRNPLGTQFRVSSQFDGARVSGGVIVTHIDRGTYGIDGVSESGRDPLRCTCPEYQANYDCPHIRATLDRVSSHAFGTSTDATQAAQAVTRDLQDVSAAAAATVDANTAGWTPAGTSMEENPEEFQTLYEEFRDARAAYKEALERGEDAEFPVPYMTEDAFGGLATRESGRGFGIEVEFSLPDTMTREEQRAARAAIGRKLRYAGLTASSVQAGYGSTHGRYVDEHAGGWSYESDPTVNGGEIVSPVMYDEPETWQNIQKVCDILREHGAVPGRSAGMHVHVGTGDYDHDVENHSRLIALSQEHEDLLYRMSTDPGRGSHRGTAYCSPNRELVGPYSDVSRARYENTGHHLAVNMQSVTGADKDHVEFRTFDATLTPAAMQSQIGVAVYMAAGATRQDTINPRAFDRHPLGERIAANPHRSALSGEDWNASTQGVRRFIDRLVPGTPGVNGKENTRVRQVVGMFAMTKWVRPSGR